MNIGDLVRHRYQPATQGGHGVVLKTKLIGDHQYYQVRWVGSQLSEGPQWFKKEDLQTISDGNKNEKNS